MGPEWLLHWTVQVLRVLAYASDEEEEKKKEGWEGGRRGIGGHKGQAC